MASLRSAGSLLSRATARAYGTKDQIAPQTLPTVPVQADKANERT